MAARAARPRPHRLLPRRRVHHARHPGLLQSVPRTSLSREAADAHEPRAAYSFLDPAKQHARVAAYIVGIAVATLLFFTIARYACVLRERLARGRGLRDTAGAGERREELQEWEEIHIEKDVRAGAAREKGAAV